MITSLSTLLMGFAIFTGIVDNPPEDLLSLGNTEKIMTTLGIEQSEEALINILGGVKTEKKLDASKLEAAIKMLREGNSKERREAKNILNRAGRDALPFFKKYVDDSDPEVSETAKNIIKKSNVAAKKAASAGVTPDTLKMLAIRRLTQMKAVSAMSAIKELTSSKNTDIAREAVRAVSILEGEKPKRLKRGEASLKALELIPEKAGFAAVLDLTEPPKTMSLAAYVKQAMKVQIPGMNADMITGQFDQFLPNILAMVGNPQIDAITMAVSDKIDDNLGWVGFVFIGSYDLKKMKKTLAGEFEKRELNGLTYYADKWGPSICPVDENTLIMSAGPSEVNHMEPFLKKLKAKSVPERFADLQDTSKSRLMAMGDLSKQQRELMKAELQKELQWLQNRNRQGPETEAERAMIDLGLLFADTQKMKAVYQGKVITFTGTLPDDAKAKKMIETVKDADEKIRKMFETVGGGMMAQFIDTKKSFSKGSFDGKKVTVKIKADFLDMGSFMPFMFMGRMGAAGPPPEVIMGKEAVEAEIRAREAVEEAKEAAEEAVKEAEK